jgi:alkaline phosphatase D
MSMIAGRLRFAVVLLVAALAACSVWAQAPADRPYVVLVSLDGFRYDYAERYHAANMLAIAKAGAAAEGLIPSFPSVTFPNHISIVTGLYPEHHGIVGNDFYDPARKEVYSNGSTPRDPNQSWYRSKPLWVVAEQQKVKSACLFWPACDAEILGVRPSYWKPYDSKFPNEQRVTQVLDWLRLPAELRPHFIAVYFDDTDTAGHAFGPESPETGEAVQRLDKLIGNLWAGIQALGLPVNLIVVSDHGMQKVDGFINIGGFVDFSKLQVMDAGAYTQLYAPDAQTAELTYRALKGKSSEFEVYRRQETPQRWHFSADPRIGDIIVIASGPNMLATKPFDGPMATFRGEHGFDPSKFRTMNGIFYAIGPNVQPGTRLAPFENVNIFPFVTKILGLQNPEALDGSLAAVAGAYRP